MKLKVFISHSSADVQKAEEVYMHIEKSGHSCFYAPRDIRTGFSYAEEIMNGIDSSNALVLILSKQSNESPHVLREIERAVSLNLPIIVYKIEEVTLTKSMEYFLMSHQWLNSSSDNDLNNITDSLSQLENNTTTKTVTAEKTENAATTGSKKTNPVTVLTYSAILIGAIALVVLLIVFAIGGNNNGGSSSANSPAESSKESVTGSTVTESSDTSSITESNEIESSDIESPSENTTESGVKLGATLTFGTYNDLPIKWRVIDVRDGKAVVISQDILTIKAYDAAESGKYNYIGNKDYWTEDISELSFMDQHKLRGSNQWHLSNIRTWLNSDRENVQYNDQPPINAAMAGNKNAYDKEAGFLSDFTDEEKKAIVPISNLTGIEDTSVTTEDKVYLLSKNELELLYEADVSICAVPTEKAAELDKSGTYKAYSKDVGVDDHYWWLRDNDGSSGYQGYLVCNSYAQNNIINYSVGVEGFGIRPAMTVDLSADIIKNNIE